MLGRTTRLATLFSCGIILVLPTGCENLPGTARTQGAVVGGVAGGAAGAAIAKENRLLGALIGAAIGAGGGYLIGTTVENADGDDEDKEAAREAARRAMDDPATADEAREAETADVNGDGFVTMDEVIAMERAGFDDDEMIKRLNATDQVFELTSEQQDYLSAEGISRRVIDAMETVNQDVKEGLLRDRPRTDVIGSSSSS